ncbi:MAG: hypothetical protein U1F81_14250 [Verrucomicrobiaceae bacterium]
MVRHASIKPDCGSCTTVAIGFEIGVHLCFVMEELEAVITINLQRANRSGIPSP